MAEKWNDWKVRNDKNLFYSWMKNAFKIEIEKIEQSIF